MVEQFMFGSLKGLDLSKCEDIDFVEEDIEEVNNSSMADEQKKEEKNEPKPNKPIGIDPLMTVAEVADYLKIRTETVLRKIYSKEIKAYKMGKEWRIKMNELNEYLEKFSNY